MKRFGNLYDKIISIENLDLAERKARKGKGKRKDVAEFDKDRDGNLQRLHETLARGEFKTSEYTTFTVYEPKERVIFKLPYFPDRVVHHAIMNVLEPIWTRTFTHNTFSCIKGRGISGCARAVERIIKEFKGRPLYCLKIDIRKFYPSVDGGAMKGIIRRKIKDARLLALLDGIIDSAEGLPIGNYVSQYLSNLYLSYFMHKVNEDWRVKATEYADDIVFFADDKAVLHGVLTKARAYLKDRLKLEIKGNWQVFPIAFDRTDRHGRALDYCGFKFYRQQKLLRKSIKQNLCRRLAKLKGRVKYARELKMSIAPWLGWCKQSQSMNLLKKILMDFQDLIKSGAVKESDKFFNCDRIGIDNIVNKRIEVLGYIPDVKTEHGSGRYVVHCKDGDKELKFFTNCKMLKDILAQLPTEGFTPFFTTITTVRDGQRKYYKFT